MLYDKRWDAKTEADPLTLDALLAWLKTQKAARKYDFHDKCGACLIGQYMAHLGIAWSMDEYKSVVWRIFGDDRNLAYRVLVELPHTLGAARARALATD